MYASTLEAPILLLGTAHVVDLRAALTRALSGRDLQGIAVELDAERAQALFAPGPTGGRRRSGGPLFLQFWAAIQRRLGEQLGAGAGDEMRVALEFAREGRLPLFCIDDPIRETIGRLLRALSFRERLALFTGSVLGLFVPSAVVEEQIGHYQESPGTLLEEMRHQFPGVTRVLLDERNEHMADRLVGLRRQGFGRLAAVVGDAHLPGLTSALHRRGIPVEAVPLARLAATAP